MPRKKRSNPKTKHFAIKLRKVSTPAERKLWSRIRKQGSGSGALVRVAAAGEWLEVQEPKASAKAKVDVENKWLKIKDSKGNVGYVAAWLVSES